MAEIQANGGGEKKGRLKKQIMRVDFTPMVDMNMLLITFFMFCTTLLKPQVMKIAMPSKEKASVETTTKFRESTAITILVGENNELFYYRGMPTEEKYKDTEFLQSSTYGEEGIRKILLDMNGVSNPDGVYNKIQDLKERRSLGKINQVLYDSLANQIQTDANVKLKNAPNVLIKMADKSSYKNMVDVLDEMMICNIGFYQIVDLNDGDRYLLYQKTKQSNYLSDNQKKELVKTN